MGRHLALGLQLKVLVLRRRVEIFVFTHQRGEPEQEPLDLSSKTLESRHGATGERFKDSDFSPCSGGIGISPLANCRGHRQ